MKRVLVYEYLSAGGPLDATEADAAELRAAGVAMRDAMVADLSRVPGVTVAAASCGEVGLPPAGEAVSARPGESPLEFVTRLSPAYDAVWAVAPESGRTLERLRDAVGAARWLGCDAASIRLTASKQATIGRLVAHGINTPLVCMTDPRSCCWVVKPDDGAGCTASRLHPRVDAAKADWTERVRNGRRATLEPWVEGHALSLSMLCAGGRAQLLSVNRQSITVEDDGTLRFDGVDVAAVTTEDPRMPLFERLVADVANAIPGLAGFVGIDLVWHAEHGPVVIEVNPRVTCAYVGLSAALGRNVAADMLDLQPTGERELAGA